MSQIGLSPLGAAVIVCGGRDYADRGTMAAHLKLLSPRLVMHGGARGADQLAGEVCVELGIPVLVEHANWEAEGRSAGPRRNTRMLTWLLEQHHPIALLAAPGGKGTADMMNQARKAGVKIIQM